MEVEDLRLFTEVVVHGGISEAARHNHMPQQTLSRHIISLERELGGSLFERSTPIVLTPIGKVVLRRAYEIVSSAEGMKAEISRVTSVTNGTVRVRRYETDSFFHLLSRVVEALQQSCANIKLEFVAKNDTDPDLVRSGAIDIGFVRQIAGSREDAAACPGAVDGEMVAVPLRSNSFPLVFGVPEGHPLLRIPTPTLSDVAAFSVAIPSFASRGAIPEAVSSLFERKGLPFRVEMVYAQTMLEYYAASDCSSVCLFNERYSVASLASQRKKYVAVSVADDTYTVSSSAIYRADNQNPALVVLLGKLVAADKVLFEESVC